MNHSWFKKTAEKLKTRHSIPVDKKFMNYSVLFLLGCMIVLFAVDRIMNVVVKSTAILEYTNQYKGLAYLFVAYILLHGFVRHLLVRVKSTELNLGDSSSQLSVANQNIQGYLEKLTNVEEEQNKQYDQLKDLEKKFSVNEEKYNELVHQMKLGMALYEGRKNDQVVNYHLVESNSNHEFLTGLHGEDLIGKRLNIIFPNLEPENLEKLQYTITTGETTRYERYQKKTDCYYEVIAYRPQLYQLATILNDITKRKLAEEAIKISEYNFRNIFACSSDAIFILDGYKVTNCNTAAVVLLGFDSKESLMGKSPVDFSPAKQPDGKPSEEKLMEVFNYCVANGKYRYEWWYQKSDGSLLPSEIMLTTMMSGENKVFHAMCRDITEQKMMEEKLQFLSYNDQLTGLYNRRFFEQELRRLDHEDYFPFTIIMADINGLKLINDSFGHKVGDEYLIKVSDVMRQGSRPKDVICRLAGDEFVILSPNTDGAEADLLIKNINNIAKTEKVGMVDLSISFGFDTKNSKEDDIAEVLKKAEDFMYKKKLFESPSMRGKTVQAIITTLNEKNKREELHAQRVSELCERMGVVLGLPDVVIRELKTVGLLHDIGKIALEDSLLDKEGDLKEEEWEEMKRHPEIGYRILSTVNDLSEMAEYVLAHHERWDGKGYPKGLQGDEIPMESQIIAIADAYDAMISERSFRDAMTTEYAVRELKKNAGIQFSPDLVKVFIEKVLNETMD